MLDQRERGGAMEPDQIDRFADLFCEIRDALQGIRAELVNRTVPESRTGPKGGGKPKNPKVRTILSGDGWAVEGKIPDAAVWVGCKRCGADAVCCTDTRWHALPADTVKPFSQILRIGKNIAFTLLDPSWLDLKSQLRVISSPLIFIGVGSVHLSQTVAPLLYSPAES